VIEALKAAAAGHPDVAHGTIPQAYACAFSDSLVDYEVAFAIDSFALTPGAKSEMLRRVADAFRDLNIHIGPSAMEVRIIRKGGLDVAPGAG
jgi:small-conductance mechanosensitive channel